MTLLATVVVAVVLVVSAFWLVVAQKRLLTHGIDEALRQRADNIHADIARGAFGAKLPSEGDREDSFLQLIDQTGRVIASSANPVTTSAVIRPLRPGSAQVIRTVPRIASDSDEFRVLARSVDTGSTANTLVVAKNLDDVNESVHILRSLLALSIPVVLSTLAILVWWLTGRVLRPVEAIGAEVASMQGTELHRRVPVPGSYDEISRLARTMNSLLDRIEHATERQRRFVADASHELRSPLTRIRTDLEVGIAHPEAADPDKMYRSLLADATQLQELIEDLLFLARSEAGSVGRPSAPVDLDDLVLDEARRLRDRGRVRVDAGAVSAARVLGDPNQLARVIRNLATNAERHAATTVTFELREYAGHSELVVADDGPGVPSEHHAAVFKRFTRLDEARSQDAGGSGLGLAIANDIVTRHAGTIGIASSDGEGARFVVTMPRVD